MRQIACGRFSSGYGAQRAARRGSDAQSAEQRCRRRSTAEHYRHPVRVPLRWSIACVRACERASVRACVTRRRRSLSAAEATLLPNCKGRTQRAASVGRRTRTSEPISARLHSWCSVAQCQAVRAAAREGRAAAAAAHRVDRRRRSPAGRTALPAVPSRFLWRRRRWVCARDRMRPSRALQRIELLRSELQRVDSHARR